MAPKDFTCYLNVVLRASTLVSRFLLIFVLARYLLPSELGLYGLLAATIAYALFAVGLDFYTYSTREIIKNNRSVWGGLLKNQIALALLFYVVLLPLLLLIFFYGALPWRIAPWFFLLLVLEHLAQEIVRLLVAMSEQLLASIVLFLRMGAWTLVAVVVLFSDHEARNLTFILACWAFGGILACAVGIYRLYKLDMGGWRLPVDWPWIWRGVKIAIVFLISSLALRALSTVDRYWMHSLTSMDVLGAYVLFMGMASALTSFLDAGVFVFVYPHLIASFHEGRVLDFRRGMRKLLVQTLSISFAYSVVAMLLIGPLLHFLNRPIYVEYEYLYPLVLFAMVLYSLGMVPHYGLYAQHQDLAIVYSHIGGVVIFVFATWQLSGKWPSESVPIGLCCAFASIFLFKLAAYLCLTPPRYRTMRLSAEVFN